MTEDFDALVATHASLKDAVDAEMNAMVKDHHSEMQYDFGNVIFWILLYEDVPFEAAAQRFQQLALPFAESLKPLEITLLLQHIREGVVEELGFDGLDAITDLASSEGEPRSMRKFPVEENLVIEARDSTRPV